jgi:hypothetical protein
MSPQPFVGNTICHYIESLGLFLVRKRFTTESFGKILYAKCLLFFPVLKGWSYFLSEVRMPKEVTFFIYVFVTRIRFKVRSDNYCIRLKTWLCHQTNFLINCFRRKNRFPNWSRKRLENAFEMNGTEFLHFFVISKKKNLEKYLMKHPG